MWDRRRFLKTLLAGTAALALDPERLLWVPGKITTFDLGAVPAMADLQLIDGILKDIYMPAIMAELNDATWRPAYLGLSRDPYVGHVAGVRDNDYLVIANV